VRIIRADRQADIERLVTSYPTRAHPARCVGWAKRDKADRYSSVKDHFPDSAIKLATREHNAEPLGDRLSGTRTGRADFPQAAARLAHPIKEYVR
jgi:hypothetical protein